MSVISAISALDLSLLPAPGVLEQLDYEAIRLSMLADLRARDPVFDALVESDPAMKILRLAAYREFLLRGHINDVARGMMLAFATGGNLDHLGANKGVVRLVLDPGDPVANPPVPPTYESDNDFRKRIQLSPEGYTTAGSEGSYIFHGLGADPDVKDIQAITTGPGDVTIYVLSRTGDGTASAGLIETVQQALSADTVRPLTDNVTVQSAEISTYSVVAELVMYPGPDAEVVRQAAEDAARAYAASVHRLRFDATRSGFFAALHRPGVVQRVNLISPAADRVAGDGEAWFATDFTVTVAEATDV